jgi:multimeric flavodoxin WrbA
MTKILVLYHSQQYGHVEKMAESLIEGASLAGIEVTRFNTNQARFPIDEYRQYDAVAVGTPDYFSYIAGTLKTFLDDWYLAKNEDSDGLIHKPMALFLAYQGGGWARQPFEMLFSHLGHQVGGIVECDGEPTPIILYACRDLGRKLAETVS